MFPLGRKLISRHLADEHTEARRPVKQAARVRLRASMQAAVPRDYWRQWLSPLVSPPPEPELSEPFGYATTKLKHISSVVLVPK